LVGLLATSSSLLAIDDHLLLCEVALRPSGAEFIEIKNPSPTPVSLDNYYLSDTSEYALLPGQFGSGPAPAIGAFDFIARFPPGSSISPEGVAVVAIDGAGFLAAFGFPANFELLATDPGTPDMLEAFAGSIGGSAGLTDAGEATILFRWDGASDLVADADLFNAAEPSAGNLVGSKTGLFVDGPDVGTTPSFYAAEAGSLPIQIATHGPSHSTKRIASEAAGDEVPGGNGISGDDETSEDSTVSWDDVFVLPDPGFCCLTLACYYSFVDESSGAAARASLHELIDDHHRIPYSSPTSWLILELAGEDPADPARILDFYKNASYPKGSGQGVDFQREHAWPQSYGFPTDSGTSAYPRSDYHALFVADSSYNASRSNLPYDTCDLGCSQRPTEANNGQGGEGGGYPGDSNWRIGAGATGSWEVWTGTLGGRRGDAARAIFYMDVRYDGSDHRSGAPEPDLIATDNRALITADGDAPQDPAYMGILSTLLEWHEQDPPDDLERWHNEAVAAWQRNRNPFVDRPDLVSCVFLSRCLIFADGFETGDPSGWSSP
jgi:endonuclease I